MGIKLFGFSCDSDKPLFTWGSRNMRSKINDGNPNKYKFKLNRRADFGKVVVVEINYPDCKNHNGNKILVYEDSAILDRGLKDNCLDPHFLKIGNSPIARFEPSETGWIYAISFARIISGKSEYNLKEQ